MERRKRDSVKAQDLARDFLDSLLEGSNPWPSFDAGDNPEAFKGLYITLYLTFEEEEVPETEDIEMKDIDELDKKDKVTHEASADNTTTGVEPQPTTENPETASHPENTEVNENTDFKPRLLPYAFILLLMTSTVVLMAALSRPPTRLFS